MAYKNLPILLLCLGLIGCAHIYDLGEPDWRVQDLPTAQVRGNITAAMHILTAKEKIKYHRDYGQDIVPVYLVVSNPTKHKVLVDVKEFARISETIIDEIGKRRIEDKKGSTSGSGESLAEVLIIPAFPLHLAAAGIKELESRPIPGMYFSFQPTEVPPMESVGGVLLLHKSDIKDSLTVKVISPDTDEKLDFIFQAENITEKP